MSKREVSVLAVLIAGAAFLVGAVIARSLVVLGLAAFCLVAYGYLVKDKAI